MSTAGPPRTYADGAGRTPYRAGGDGYRRTTVAMFAAGIVTAPATVDVLRRTPALADPAAR